MATKKSDSKKENTNTGKRGRKDSVHADWVEPGVDTRFTWQDFAEMPVGTERDAPEGVSWQHSRNAIRQLVKRVGGTLRLLMKQVVDKDGKPTGRVIIRRVA